MNRARIERTREDMKWGLFLPSYADFSEECHGIVTVTEPFEEGEQLCKTGPLPYLGALNALPVTLLLTLRLWSTSFFPFCSGEITARSRTLSFVCVLLNLRFKCELSTGEAKYMVEGAKIAIYRNLCFL